MSKKVLSLVLALVMVLGTFGTAFADTTEAPAINEKIEKLKELGLVQGYEDGTYGLENPITRAEMATMIVRSLGLESAAVASQAFPSQFSDMNGANVLWARGYVNVAVGQGVVKGYPEGTFLPANNVTYAEAIAMLVRAGNHITAAEEAVAVWPATYLTKAAQIGLLNGIEGIVDYNAPALRGKLFELVYNAAEIGGNLFVASTLQGIVVENYRTESLDKDEIVVHAMKDQVARSATDKEANTKYYEENDEFEVVITEELSKKGLDVETLLGKVVEISFDRSNKIVDIKELAGYQYIIGPVDSITDKKIEINEKEYTVSKSEARNTTDERLYQAYLNNKDVDYDALYTRSTANAEYANITVRNGKVLFIDAYKFDDIAPVAKDIDDKDRVSYYDDARDGSVRVLEVEDDDYVIEFADGKMKLGNKADISADDVIHFYKDTVIVRPAEDNKVEGTFTRVAETRSQRDRLTITVEGEEYRADVKTTGNRNPVYSRSAADLEFETVTYADYDEQLDGFRNEEVVLLRDILGRVQLISSERVDGSFYSILLDRLNREWKLYTENNETNYYEISLRDTDFEEILVGETVKDARVDAFGEFDLVRATAKDELLTKATRVELSSVYSIYSMDRDVVEINGGVEKVLSRNAVIFEVDEATGRVRAYDVAAFLSKYGTRNKITEEITDVQFYEATPRRSSTRMVEVIVIKNDLRDMNADTITAEVTRIFQDRTDNDNWYLRLDNGKEVVDYLYGKNRPVYNDAASTRIDVKDILTAVVTGDKDKPEVLVRSVEEVTMYGAFEVLSYRNGFLTLADGRGTEKSVQLSDRTSSTKIGDYNAGNYVRINVIDPTKIITVIDNVGTVRDDNPTMAYWDNAPTPVDNDVITSVYRLDGKLFIRVTGRTDALRVSDLLETKAEGFRDSGVRVILTIERVDGEDIVTNIVAR